MLSESIHEKAKAVLVVSKDCSGYLLPNLCSDTGGVGKLLLRKKLRKGNSENLIVHRLSSTSAFRRPLLDIGFPHRMLRRIACIHRLPATLNVFNVALNVSMAMFESKGVIDKLLARNNLQEEVKLEFELCRVILSLYFSFLYTVLAIIFLSCARGK